MDFNGDNCVNIMVSKDGRSACGYADCYLFNAFVTTLVSRSRQPGIDDFSPSITEENNGKEELHANAMLLQPRHGRDIALVLLLLQSSEKILNQMKNLIIENTDEANELVVAMTNALFTYRAEVGLTRNSLSFSLSRSSLVSVFPATPSPSRKLLVIAN